MPKLKRLRVAKVKPKTLALYSQAVKDFREWALQSGRPLRSHKRVDEAMCLYLDALCEDGVTITYGSYAVYGWIMLASDEHCDPRDQLPFSKQALKGWRSRFPSKVRSGIDLSVWDVIAKQCVDNGCPLAACAILIQGDSYLRTGELFAITTKHIIPPSASRHRGIWGIIVGMLECGEPSKNKDYDDCVLFNSVGRLDVNRVVAMLAKRKLDSSTCIFHPLTPNNYNLAIKQAAQKLGIVQLQLSGHMLRHSGASHDSYHDLRESASIQARGRWKCAESMRRYKRPGRMLLNQKGIPRGLWAKARNCRGPLIDQLCKLVL